MGTTEILLGLALLVTFSSWPKSWLPAATSDAPGVLALLFALYPASVHSPSHIARYHRDVAPGSPPRTRHYGYLAALGMLPLPSNCRVSVPSTHPAPDRNC
uniref:Putative secreted protein n=1 Tax=Anopheles darlingi TaxID=43151 RepID=A0A2M4D5S1_ANODA